MRKTLSLLLLLSSPALAGTLDAPVVGGTAVPAGEWPDAVAVVAPTALCTGTLIAPDVVLTAGHCIDTHPVEVIVGAVDLAKPGGDAIKVKAAYAYPDWEHHYDVGVLVLDHVAPARPRPVASACTARDLSAGAEVRVVGFGLTTRSGKGENLQLHEAKLPVVDAECTHDPACAAAVAPGGEFTAGGHGTDACFGDSGGPIYLDGSLIGVVSRGVGTTGEPCGGGGVYVRADKVVAWIERVTTRKIPRASCDAPADGEGTAEEPGGCSVGGGALGGGALIVLAALWLLTIPRRRESRSR